MKTWVAVVVAGMMLAALCLFVVSPANAHRTSWYWNRYKAQYELVAYGIEWDDDFDEVWSARCYGYGPWIKIKPRGGSSDRNFGFKHFRCRVSADDDEDYWIVFHVLDRDTWTPVFLRWA